jgi:dolichol-phosphate mannosyltransferase
VADATEKDCLEAPGGNDDRGKLTLIVPVYNEADNIRNLLTEIEGRLSPPFQVLIVYDFAEDTTVPVVQELMATLPWLRLVKNDLGRGVVYALRAGFREAKQGPALVVMADLSDDLGNVEEMLRLYDQGYRVICPSRYMRGGQQIGGPLLKRWLSRLAGVSLYWLGFPTHDATNNYRMYDAELINRLTIESSGGFELALELTAKAFAAGAAVTEVPTTWRDRTAGESRFQMRKWLPKYLYWYLYAARAAVGRWFVRRGSPY